MRRIDTKLARERKAAQGVLPVSRVGGVKNRAAYLAVDAESDKHHDASVVEAAGLIYRRRGVDTCFRCLIPQNHGGLNRGGGVQRFVYVQCVYT